MHLSTKTLWVSLICVCLNQGISVLACKSQSEPPGASDPACRYYKLSKPQGKIDDSADDGYGDSDEGYSFIRDTDARWVDGKIPYRILNDNNRILTPERKAMIRQQMSIFETQLPHGCIEFIDQESNPNIYSKELHIHSYEEVCKCTIGSRAISNLTLGHPLCFENNGSTILHELGHALGMMHEQNRPDRDKYVEISECLSSHIVREDTHGETYQTPYDFFSISHYTETKGCSNGKVCMVVKEPYRTFFKDRSLLKSYPNKLSAVDVVEISRAYNCPVTTEMNRKYEAYKSELCTIKEGEYDPKTGICFKYIEQRKTWTDARNTCRDLDGDLFSIHSQEENDFVQSRASRGNGYDSWIGLNDLTTEGIFQWSDGSAVGYTNWRANQPNGGEGQNCVAASYTDGKWYDNDCEYTLPAICKIIF